VAKIVIGAATAVASAAAVALFGLLAGFFDNSDEPAQDASAAPFTVSTSLDVIDFFDAWLDGPMPPSRSWPGPYLDQWRTFMADAGAAFTPTRMRLVLDGTGQRTATITQATAVKDDCSEPSPGAHFSIIPEGEAAPVGWSFDLGESAPVALNEDGRPYFEGKTISLAPGEVITIDVTTHPGPLDCRWTLLLDVTVGGERQTVTIDDDGQPFRTTGGDPELATHAMFAISDGIAGPDNIDAQIRVIPTSQVYDDFERATEVYNWDGSTWTLGNA